MTEDEEFKVETAVVEIVNHSQSLSETIASAVKRFASGATANELAADVWRFIQMNGFKTYSKWLLKYAYRKNKLGDALLHGLVLHYVEGIAGGPYTGEAHRIRSKAHYHFDWAFEKLPEKPVKRWTEGDEVYITAEGPNYGRRCKVIEICADGLIKLEGFYNSRHYLYEASQLTLAKPADSKLEEPEQPMPYQYKPGDRVKLVGKRDPRAGELGSITEVFHDSISHDGVTHVRVQLDNGDHDGFHVNNIQLVQQEQQIMTNAPAIENKTFVFGTDTSKMTDDDLYGAITTIGAEIERLGKVSPKPKKLEAKIKELQEQQQKIAELVDSRS